jgi:recombination protein RecR
MISKVLQDAVDEFAQLPGVGQRTAFRFVLHLLKKKPEELEHFGQTFITLRENVRHCRVCYTVTDKEVCEICSDQRRDRSVICVVEDIRDVVAFENTSQFKGTYHVLGGIISPMDGIGPSDLRIAQLVERCASGEVREVILALSTTMEGDTTNFYLFRQLKPTGVAVTTLSRGVSVGGGLEYTDEVTLGRSLVQRVPYETMLSR